MIVWHRLGRVRVPPLARLRPLKIHVSSFAAQAAAAWLPRTEHREHAAIGIMLVARDLLDCAETKLGHVN